jgi:hypothetical protein
VSSTTYCNNNNDEVKERLVFEALKRPREARGGEMDLSSSSVTSNQACLLTQCVYAK